MKKQDKTPEKQLNDVEIGKLPEKEFRIMIVKMIQDLRKRMEAKDFPGDAVVNNPSANAGGMGSSPGPGRSHMLLSNKACAPQLLSLHSGALEPQLLSPRATATETHKPRAFAP